jgi:hypothetical protein
VWFLIEESFGRAFFLFARFKKIKINDIIALLLCRARATGCVCMCAVPGISYVRCRYNF